MPGSAQIGNLAVNLSLETAAFQRGAKAAETRVERMRGKFASATKSVSGLGAALGVGLGVAALSALTRNAFDMASAMDESAQKMGVTVEALQELNLAAEQSGISQESLAGAMRKLNKSMGDLFIGRKQATEAFAAIGLAAEDLRGKSPEQALRVIADALNQLPTVQERVANGSKIMGKNFSELLPLINGGSAALDKYAETSRKQGQITTEEAKRLDELADSWERLKVRIGVFTAKVIAMFVELNTNLDGLTNRWFAWRDKTLAATAAMAAGVVNYINNMVTGISQAITGKLSPVWEGLKAKTESVKNAFRSMYDAVVGHSYVPDMVEGIAQSMAQLQQIMVDPALNATQKVGAAFQSLAGVIGKLFGTKAGSIIGAIGQLAMALGPLFGKGVPSSGVSAADEANVVGMARGGSGVFGGRPGIDRNVLSLNGSPIARVSRGERFSVGANDAAPTAKVMIVPTPYFDAVVDNRSVAVAAPMAGQAAVMGATGGMAGMQRRVARTLP